LQTFNLILLNKSFIVIVIPDYLIFAQHYVFYEGGYAYCMVVIHTVYYYYRWW